MSGERGKYTVVNFGAITILETALIITASICLSPLLSLAFLPLPDFAVPVKPGFCYATACELGFYPHAASFQFNKNINLTLLPWELQATEESQF